MENNSTWLFDTYQLKGHLFSAMKMGTGPNGPEEYIPYSTLDSLITRTEVDYWIRRLDDRLSQTSRQVLSRHICHGPIFSRQNGTHGLARYLNTTCKRIFATLVLIDEVRLDILAFLEMESMCDADLFCALSSARDQHDEVVANFCQLLGPDAYRKFYHTQWKVLVPIFRTQPDGEVPITTFPDHTIFPWVTSDRSRMLGTTSNVFPISIDRNQGHLELKTREGTEPTKVALKEFMDCIEEPTFDAEVAALKRFTRSSDNANDNPQHEHIMELLAAFKRAGRFYLICPLADSDLSTLLHEAPNVLRQPGSAEDKEELKRWIFSQCLGLATALSNIHVYQTKHTATSPTGTESVTVTTEYGVHGDIKPENILFYSSPSFSSSPSSPIGALKLCDFGQMTFRPSSPHALKENTGQHLSAIYRSPEQYYPTRLARSQESDIFALGCLFLEMLVWDIQGPEALDEFADERKGDRENADVWARIDGGRIFGGDEGEGGERKGRYFKFELTSEGREVVPFMKRVVIRRISALRFQTECEVVKELITFIGSEMLNIDDSRRPTCREVVARLRASIETLDIVALEKTDLE